MKITRIETIRLADTPYVLYVRVHTDEGLVGTGDTFMMAEALEGYIHGRAAPKLLGKDPTQIQRHWTALYDNDAARFGGLGIEVRAISAIDVALWDILGQSVGRPIYQLLGGRVARPRADLQHVRWPRLRPAAVRGPRPARPARGPARLEHAARGPRRRAAGRGRHGHEDLAVRRHRHRQPGPDHQRRRARAGPGARSGASARRSARG